jgi:uncharacterized protein YciI
MEGTRCANEKRSERIMSMKKGSQLYVRIDYRVGEKFFSDQDFQDHLAYVENIAKERYLIGGGFSNTDGGMILFEAKNFEEAQKIALHDPLVVRGLYRYELFTWDLVVLSKDMVD